MLVHGGTPCSYERAAPIFSRSCCTARCDSRHCPHTEPRGSPPRPAWFRPPPWEARCSPTSSRHIGHPCPPRRGARRPVHVLDSCPRSDRGRTTSDMSSGEHANRDRSAPRSVLLSGGTDVTAQVAAPTKSSGARVAVQKFGTFLSGMIMPNIAAFIAWGFITAFFIQTGWTPVPGLGGFGTDGAGQPNLGLVAPMIRFMLPLLIAMQGGRMVYGVRGGVVAVVATMGVIVSTTQPMFLGALIMAPFAAWVMKQLDRLWEGKIKPGFEMLVNNFSAGIVAAALAVVGYFAFGP